MQRIKKSLILTIVVSSALFICPVCSFSAATTRQINPPMAGLQQVALFKNGLGFFVSEVTCPAGKKSFSFVPAVAASHGTFWVAYSHNVKLETLIAKEVESKKSMEAISIEELLRANVGKRVRLSFDDKGDSTLEGLIRFFAENRPNPLPDPYSPGQEESGNEYRYTRPPSRATLIIVQTEAGEVAVDSQKIRRMEFPDGKPETSFTSKSKSVQLDVELEAPAGGEKLTISFLAKGITWAPSYIVDITNDDKADISAKAVVINEACNLDDVTVQLVTGFPHLQFSNIVSPLARKENLAKFLQSLTRGASERGRVDVTSNVMMQSVEYFRGKAGPGGGIMPAYAAAEQGKATEDLFFYPLEDVKLGKNQVAYFPLFTQSVPYKHIFQWQIPDYVDEEYSRQRNQQEKPEEVVWHCLRLQNTTKVPWTTAPAQTVKEQLILGQDTLSYTPVDAKTTLRITRAVGVKAEQIELEIERERDAAQLYGYHYDLLTIEGNLSVTSFQEKPISLEITKTLSGEVKSSQPVAEIEKLARGLRRMNGVKELTWTIELAPGQTKPLSYVYKVYVRR